MINLGSEVGSVCSEGPWLFVGLPNVVKVSLKLSDVLFQFFSCHIEVFFWVWSVHDVISIWYVDDAAGVEY